MLKRIISGGQTGAEDHFDNLFLGQLEADIQVVRPPTFPSGNPASRKPPMTLKKRLVIERWPNGACRCDISGECLRHGLGGDRMSWRILVSLSTSSVQK